MPVALPKPRPMTVMLGLIICGLIVGGMLGFLIRRRKIRRRRETHPSSPRSHPHNSDIEARRLSQVMMTRERPPLSPVASCCDNSSQSGFGMMARLPSFESTHTPFTSTQPSSAHQAGHTSPPSTFHGPLPATFSRTQSDPHITSGHISESDVPREDASRKRLFEKKERHRRTKYRSQSLDARIDQAPSWPAPQATLVALPRASMESIERLDHKSRHRQDYPSPFMHDPGSSSGSLLLEMFPRKGRESTEESTVWSHEGRAATEGGDGRPWERRSDLRVTAASILETTEKPPPGRVLRKKLLSFISNPSRPATAHDAREEKKYYWEMLHVHTDDSWWQLPFPPPLSPIDHTFQLPDPIPSSLSSPSPALQTQLPVLQPPPFPP